MFLEKRRMIDIKSESLLTLAQAAAMLPGKPSLCALWRWRKKGIRGRQLESVVIGGKVYTSVEALARFAQQQGSADGPKTTRTLNQSQRAIDAAERELQKAGV
jgi:hypothetical protein